ncbi:unnamed protein product [Ectocarpus sp. CCAP 1310/34]|nr:unnamed protein product [Ectocarpus sp. CCAP 1310/34]
MVSTMVKANAKKATMVKDVVGKCTNMGDPCPTQLLSWRAVACRSRHSPLHSRRTGLGLPQYRSHSPRSGRVRESFHPLVTRTAPSSQRTSRGRERVHVISTWDVSKPSVAKSSDRNLIKTNVMAIHYGNITAKDNRLFAQVLHETQQLKTITRNLLHTSLAHRNFQV